MRKGIVLERGTEDKIVAALVTRFDGTVPATRRALRAAAIDEWGRLRIANDGDLIRAVGAQRGTLDRRDASWVRVC